VVFAALALIHNVSAIEVQNQMQHKQQHRAVGIFGRMID